MCVETRTWRTCSLGGAHGSGTQCNSGWTSTWECAWLPGHNGTGGPGSTPNNETTEEDSRGGGTSTENDETQIYVAPIIPTPLELETAAFFENLTEEENECINEGFGQFKNDIKTFFKNNQEANCTAASIQNPDIDDNGFAGVIPLCVKTFADNAVDAFCDGGEIDSLNDVIIVDGPENPITDLTDFFECFDVTQDAIVTVYAVEPIPGSGEPRDGKYVGHTFVSINQGVNTSVFGYYPVSDWINPFNISGTAVLGDDGSGNQDFTASIST